MKILKAYKFRIYPTKEQEILINKTFGCARLVYNIMLAKIKNNSSLSKYDLIKIIPSLYLEYPFLKEVDSVTLRNVVTDLFVGIEKYNKKLGGYPKFKKKRIKDNYRTNLISRSYKDKVYNNIKLDLKQRLITLPKLKQLKMRGYRKLQTINGKIINVTVKKEANKYYVAVLIEENVILPTPKSEIAVGIDIGVKNIVVTSKGEYFGNPKYLKKYEKKIKKLQKDLFRKIKDSKNYYKTKLKLQEVYRKLKNARKKLAEEIVSKIIKNNDIIIAEKLKVKAMLENKKQSKLLRKEIANATFSDILKKLEYKCIWLNKKFYQVDTYYASSQVCSRCGNINKEMQDLSNRIYYCSKCGLEKERDLNASINIMQEGLNKIFKERCLI